MFEFHGWIVLNYHPKDIDTDLQNECFKKCEAYITNRPDLSDNNYKFVNHNGISTFLISGLHNHFREYVTDIFNWIGKNAPGSYGLLYISDDEDRSNPEGFTVFAMKKGKLSQTQDQLLSPRIPAIEDKWKDKP
jgi:Immunity protein 7